MTYQHGNPMQVEPLVRYAVAAWLAEGGESLVWERIERLIAFRSTRATTEKHLRFWVETTWWNWDGIGKDLGQPMNLASRGGDGPGGRSRQPTRAPLPPVLTPKSSEGPST